MWWIKIKQSLGVSFQSHSTDALTAILITFKVFNQKLPATRKESREMILVHVKKKFIRM